MTWDFYILPNNSIDFSLIDTHEMDILDQVINKFRNYKANEIVDYMHNEIAYLKTMDGQEIPFSLAKELKDF